MYGHTLPRQEVNLILLVAPLAAAGVLITLAAHQPPARFNMAGTTIPESPEDPGEALPRTIRGECLHAQRSILEVDADGRVWRTHLQRSTAVTLDGRPAGPDVLESGQFVEVDFEDSDGRLVAERVDARSRMKSMIFNPSPTGETTE